MLLPSPNRFSNVNPKQWEKGGLRAWSMQGIEKIACVTSRG